MVFERITYKLLLFFLWSVVLGQLARIPIGGIEGGVYLSEVILAVMVASWLTWRFFSAEGFQLSLVDAVVFFFASIACISLIWAFSWTSFSNIIVGGFYLARLLLYLSLFRITQDVIQAQPQRATTLWKTMFAAVFVFALIGIAQFAIFPDFSKYVQHGWDPHYYRVLSTFFDPNYAGLLLSFGLLAGLYKLYQKPTLSLVAFLTVVAAAFVLTFSRSSYFAFICGLTVFSVWKDKRLLILFGLLGLIVFLTVPRVQSRVIGAFTIDETAQLRLDNYQQTFKIIHDHWLLGVGFNTYRSAQSEYGIFRDERGVSSEGGHAGGGADNSFLFTWATMGIIGLVTLLIMLGVFTWYALVHHASTAVTLGFLVAMVVHTQFVNSLYFVWLLAFFSVWFVTTINYGEQTH